MIDNANELYTVIYIYRMLKNAKEKFNAKFKISLKCLIPEHKTPLL